MRAFAVRSAVRSRFAAAFGLLVAGACVDCRALDRDRYHALLEAGHPESAVSDALGDATDAPTEGGACTSSTDGGTTEAGCHLVVPPSRTANAQDLGTTAPPHVFAVHRLTFGFTSSDVWHGIGFDRDGYCTNPSSAPTQGCRPIGGGTTVEDGTGGRDDSFATGIGSLLATFSFNEPSANASIAMGVSTLGARIRSLGGPDDAEVVIEWFPLMHGFAADGTSMPQWDGRDTWAIDARLAYDPAVPGAILIRSTTGYTACGTLVARLPSRVPFRFAGTVRLVKLTLSGGVIAGPIDPLGHSLGPIDLSAAWAVNDAAVDFGLLGICPPTDGGSSQSWNLANQLLRGSADLLSTGESSPAVECDAISVAFRVEFTEIGLRADEMSPTTPETLCPP